MRVLPWNAVIMASGNNITLSEDTVRRVLVARLESPVEKPEERTGFKHPHLYEWIIDERPRLVVAALTILRAFALSGGKFTGQTWGSFEAWSRLVPGAIVFAGGADPMLARPNIEQHATDASRALPTVLAHLPILDAGSGGLTCREIIQKLYPEKMAGEERSRDGFDDLRDALEAWTNPKPGQAPSLQVLGKRMQAHVGRFVGGRRLDRVGGGGSTAVRWGVR